MSASSIESVRLYVIVDREAVGGRDPVEVAEAALLGGADCIQWRDKASADGPCLEVAHRMREVTRRQGALFVVNDRVAVAMQTQADGVHVGHEDLPVPEVRKRVGHGMLIGRSTHSLEEALRAEAEGADYIGVGPVFSTPTKPGYPAAGTALLAQVRARVRIPWVAIGGIDLKNLPLVLSAGAVRVAVVRGVCAAPDPEAAARALKEKLAP